MHDSLEFMTQQQILRGLGLTLDQGLSPCMNRPKESTVVNGSNTTGVILALKREQSKNGVRT